MGLTEVVYKIRSEIFPLCTFTGRNPDVKAIINQMSWDDATRTSTAIVTLMGPDDKLRQLAAELGPMYDQVETIHESREQLILKARGNVDTLKKSGNPTAFALEYFGENAIVQPALVREGYFNTRLLIAAKVDLADLLANYERGVKDGKWNDFKLIRIDDYDADQQINGAFTENLTQKQMEVIKTALALGFYNTPRDITLDDLSNIFGISKAAVHNRLQAAERKVIAKFFS